MSPRRARLQTERWAAAGGAGASFLSGFTSALFEAWGSPRLRGREEGQAVPLPGRAEAPPDRRPPRHGHGRSLSGLLLLPEAVLWMGSASLPRRSSRGGDSQMVLLRLMRTQAHPALCQTGKQRLPGQRPPGTLRAGGRPDSEPACPCGGRGLSSTGFAVRKRSPLRPGEVSAETRAPRP